MSLQVELVPRQASFLRLYVSREQMAGYVYQACLCASNNGFGIILLVGGIFAVRKGYCRSHFWAILLGELLAAFFLLVSFLTDFELGLRKVALARPELNLDDLRRELGFRKWLELRRQSGWDVAGIKLTEGAVV